MIGVGSKVVCVQDCLGINSVTLDNADTPNGIPKKGEIYVVAGIRPAGELMGLVLIGKPGYRPDFGFDLGWDSRKFRTIEESRCEQEMEYYRSLPVHSPQPEMQP